jgi:hypothetical protein
MFTHNKNDNFLVTECVYVLNNKPDIHVEQIASE